MLAFLQQGLDKSLPKTPMYISSTGALARPLPALCSSSHFLPRWVSALSAIPVKARKECAPWAGATGSDLQGSDGQAIYGTQIRIAEALRNTFHCSAPRCQTSPHLHTKLRTIIQHYVSTLLTVFADVVEMQREDRKHTLQVLSRREGFLVRITYELNVKLLFL